MLKVTREQNGETITLRLEGALAGQWVEEMLRCWRELSEAHARSTRIDLSGLTWASSEGRELLALMYRNGAELVAADVLMKAIVEEIVAGD
ncbi:MAG TPA: hypothetical protein VID27_00075 [Blastocatellia bacterium]|jgi:hypothetical protein